MTPAPAIPSATKPAAAAPVEKKRTIPLGLIIALNVVLALTIALVVYFVLRPTPKVTLPEGALPEAPAMPKTKLPEAPAVSAPEAPKQ